MRYTSSPSGRFVTADDDLARLLGYASAAELIAAVGDIATQFYAEPNLRAAAHDALARDGRLERFVAPVRRKDGGVVWLAEHARQRRTATGGTLIDGVVGYNGVSWLYFNTVGTGTNQYILNTTDKTIKVHGLNSFSLFALTDKDDPLPVELNLFTSTPSARDIKLKWETETEVNSYGFE